MKTVLMSWNMRKNGLPSYLYFSKFFSMKFNFILATICLVLGASVSWFLKPEIAQAHAEIENEDDRVSSSRSSRQTYERGIRGGQQLPRDLEVSRRKRDSDSVEERQFSNKVEAEALTKFAKLLHLDLTQEQRDNAFEILYEQAEIAHKHPINVGSPFSRERTVALAKAKVEFDVNLLSQVLDEDQLEQYRENLVMESQTISIYGRSKE